MSVRCLIVDDSVRFLDVARSLLSRDGIEVVGTATTSSEALGEIDRLRPDVVLVDVSLGEESGFDLSRTIADRRDPPSVVLISTRAEEDYAPLIAAFPVLGFIPKSRLSPERVRQLLDRPR